MIGRHPSRGVQMKTNHVVVPSERQRGYILEGVVLDFV